MDSLAVSGDRVIVDGESRGIYGTEILPLQSWENYRFELPPEIDKSGSTPGAKSCSNTSRVSLPGDRREREAQAARPGRGRPKRRHVIGLNYA